MGDRNVLERILSGLEEPTNLSLAVLQEITENFSEKRKIGEGGFGEVYKGMLQNGIVAVKRIILTEHTVDDKLFHREVKNLMRISSHRNVVRFLGFCSDSHHKAILEEGSADFVLAQIRERLLCFEYIGNGSLDKHITDELRGLEWSLRYEIIKGICHGLHHLHEKNNIIHMDLKPGNIMLDDDMVPKITDFGLSRHDKHTHTSGTRFITRGYCAPEYENGGKTSGKADVYSLGVIIVELVTGHKGDPNKANVLRRWRHRWNNSPKHSLLSQWQQVAACLHIAALCRKKEPADRPSILDIIGILSETGSTDEDTDQKQITSIVELTNKTNDYYAFNIETPSQQYHTEPNKGIVSPQSKCTIQITMQAHETAPQDMPYTDDFLVLSTKVDRELRAEDITEHVFNKEPGEVDEVNLTVVVYEPGETKESPKGRDDTKKKRKRMAESAFSKDKPGVIATRQAEPISMDINSSSYKDARGQCTKQLEHIGFHATPRISRNQQTKMSNRAVDVATGAMGSLLHKLGNLLKEEYNLKISVKTDIESLSEELMEMQLALCKVSDVHRDNLDYQVQRWANSAREMSYDIEDVVDGFLDKSQNLCGDAIKEIKKQVQVMADRRKRCKVDDAVANVAPPFTIDPRISAIYKDKKGLVGIKEQINKLIKWVSDRDGDEDVSKQQLKIVSIVGFGGLGKTTLAKAVYDELKSQFSHQAFVPVGRNPNVKKVFEHILHGLGYGSNATNLNEMQLIDTIRGLLMNKKYFIVIDDIWDSSAWDLIQCAFIDDNCGSCVVTTTRIRTVADNCCIHSRGYVHTMEPLNDQDSRKLFASRIFGSQEAHPDVLDEISNDVLKKCHGLPLAIISIASLLVNSPRSRWDSVRNSLVSVFEENHDELKNMEQVLNLSYMHLPLHLRTCLLDIGKYPEDRTIEKLDLMRQWTAQGFVIETRRRDAEDVAEDYFYALINMSMIQPAVVTAVSGEVIACTVHDIMLDFIRSKAIEENFILVIDGPEVVTGEHTRVRRVSICNDDEEDSEIVAAINWSSLSHVRSVFLPRASLVPSFLVLKYIQVLHIEDSRCERLDLTGIHGLFLLRYLNICCSEHFTLPFQIGELRQLETLLVKVTNGEKGGHRHVPLPSDIVTLPRLQTLCCSKFAKLVLPDGIGKLKSLRTLQGVDVSGSSVDNIKGLGELNNLRNLKIDTWKRIFSDVDNMRLDALCSSIGKISGNLRSLIVRILGSFRPPDHAWSITLTPPPRLRRLDLGDCVYQRIPQWIAQLRELDVLYIGVREVADGLSIVAGLPSLTDFRIHTRHGKAEERVIISASGFRALKVLCFCCAEAPLAFQAGALPRLEGLRLYLRYNMSAPAQVVPVGIEHLPAGTLQRIVLYLADDFAGEEGKPARLLLRSAFEAHHPTADMFF